RGLADPEQSVETLRPGRGDLEEACASWGALNYALRSLLGWHDVGAGLAWWYRAGRPVDSPVLALVQRVWGADDLIDYYAAWAWRPAGWGWMAADAFAAGEGRTPADLAARSPYWPDEDWWRAFARRGAVLPDDPFHGGSDALHLGVHHGPPIQTASGKAIVATTSRPRHAVLVVGGIDSWLADLEHEAAKLPPLGGRSWRVEIFDRQVGWL